MTPNDIIELRKRLGSPERAISQVELATMLGVDQATISRWETGTHKPDGPATKLLEQLDNRQGAAA